MSKQLSLDETDALYKLRIRYAECKHQYEISILRYNYQYGDVKMEDEPSRIKQILQKKVILDIQLIKINMDELETSIKKIVQE